MLDRLTPLIITFNEVDNISRTLAALDWAKRIVVVDSGSTDGTLDVFQADPRIDVLVRPFDNFARQCNAGLARVNTEWVLSLDADYVVTRELVEELAATKPDAQTSGYSVAFDYCIDGHSLRGSLYPPRVCVHRKAGASYCMNGHGHRVELTGRIEALGGRIQHDDRKHVSRWLAAQARYAEDEVQDLALRPWSAMGWADRVRRMIVIAPWLVPLYCLIVKRGLLDGLPGWHYALQRGIAEAVLSLKLIEARLGATRASAAKEN
jgi:glycosyltransferase involved in cell wall biosynthesis